MNRKEVKREAFLKGLGASVFIVALQVVLYSNLKESEVGLVLSGLIYGACVLFAFILAFAFTTSHASTDVEPRFIRTVLFGLGISLLPAMIEFVYKEPMCAYILSALVLSVSMRTVWKWHPQPEIPESAGIG